MEEIWKEIEGTNGKYMISNIGNVKTSSGYKKKFLSDNVGYCRVSLYNHGYSKFKLVHRLVAQAFIPNPENKPQVNHKNGIKNDNRVDNLEWVTRSENIRHSYDVLGKVHPKGFDNHRSKKVYQYDFYGNLIEVHPSLNSVKLKGFNIVKISHCTSNRNKSSYGYVWSYEQLTKSQIISKFAERKSKRPILQKYGNCPIAIYLNQYEAMKINGINRTYLSRCLNNKMTLFKGYKYELL